MTTFVPFLDSSIKHSISLENFYLTDSALFAKRDNQNEDHSAAGACIIFYFKEKKLVTIADTNKYNAFAKKNSIPELDSFKDFNHYYWQFRNGKSFWQKFLVP